MLFENLIFFSVLVAEFLFIYLERLKTLKALFNLEIRVIAGRICANVIIPHLLSRCLHFRNVK